MRGFVAGAVMTTGVMGVGAGNAEAMPFSPMERAAVESPAQVALPEAFDPINSCVWVVQVGDSEFSISQATGKSQQRLADENDYNKGAAQLLPGMKIDVCINGLDDTKTTAPDAATNATTTTTSATPTTATAENTCTYSVVAGDSEYTISDKTSVSRGNLANENHYELGKAKLVPGMKIDKCVNGIDDKKSTATTPNTPATTVPVVIGKATNAQACEALGNYPKEVRAIPGFRVEPMTGTANQLQIIIDKSSHVQTGRLSLKNGIDYDYNASTGVCAVDPKESGNVDITFSSYVGVNPTNTPEGDFTVSAPFDTTCYKHDDGTRSCVLNEFKSLIGTSNSGKNMNGNIGMHEIPTKIPKGMSLADAFKQIDTLPKIHSEAALQTAVSSACIREAIAVNTLIGRYYKTATVHIQA